MRFEALFSGRFFYDSFPAAFRLVLTSVLADVVTSVQDPDPRGHLLRGLAGRDPGVNSAFKNDEFCRARSPEQANQDAAAGAKILNYALKPRNAVQKRGILCL